MEQSKKDVFGQIEQGANRKGLYYSGVPIQEQAGYTGGQFLPAVANLKSRYTQQRFNLQDALAKLTQEQYGKAYGIRQGELDTEAAERAAAASRAAGAGGGGFAPSLDRGAPTDGGGAVLPARGANFGAMARNTNPWVWSDFIRDANNAYFGGQASYGQMANWVESNMGRIGNGSAADLALRNRFLGTDLLTGGAARPQRGPVRPQFQWG